jgi:hypothetical protein
LLRHDKPLEDIGFALFFTFSLLFDMLVSWNPERVTKVEWLWGKATLLESRGVAGMSARRRYGTAAIMEARVPRAELE